MWTVEVNTWERESGGEGSGIYMSKDSGDTWTKLEGNGLPTLLWARRICASRPQTRIASMH